jgi:hypothetical protein
MPVFQKPLFLPKAVSAAFLSGRRSMSATAKVWVNKDTRVICQGFTGKQVRAASDLCEFVVAMDLTFRWFCPLVIYFREHFIRSKQLIMERKWWVE